MALPRAEAAQDERTLFQEADMVYAAAGTLLTSARRLDERLRGPREQVPEIAAEISVSSPAAILQNAYGDISRATVIIEALSGYVGQPGEGHRF